MAAGKNIASEILEGHGFISTDADKLGHLALEDSKVLAKISQTFSALAGEKNLELFDPDGRLIRKSLGAIIFEDAELVKKHEEIVYPRIIELFEDFFKANEGHDIILNAAVLYKIPDLMKKVDLVIYVDCPKIIRYFRTRKRDNLPGKQILDRFKMQRNLLSKYKKTGADTVRVWNISSQKALERKLFHIIRNRLKNR